METFGIGLCVREAAELATSITQPVREAAELATSHTDSVREAAELATSNPNFRTQTNPKDFLLVGKPISNV